MTELTLRPNADGQYAQWSEWQATDIFASGLEIEDDTFTVEWTGKTVTSGEAASVITADPHHGSKHANFQCDGSGTGEQAYAYKTFAGQAIVYARMYVKFKSGLPGATQYFTIMVLRGTGNILWLQVMPDRWKLNYRNAGATESTDVMETPTLDTWYMIEVYAKVHATGGEYGLWIDGVQKVFVTGKDSDEYGNITDLRVGYTYTSWQGGRQEYIDCVIVSDSQIGDDEHYGRTSDQSDNTGLRVVGSTTLKELLNLENASQTETINSVTAYVRAKASGSDPPEQLKILWRTHSTDYESGDLSVSRTAFTDYSEQKTTKPNTGSAWTWDEVNALQIGARASALASGETIWVSELWIVVYYTIAGGVMIDGKILDVEGGGIIEGEEVVGTFVDKWQNASYAKEAKIFGTIRLWTLPCYENNVAWTNSAAKYLQDKAKDGNAVSFSIDEGNLHQVTSTNVYILGVAVRYGRGAKASQFVRFFTLKLQEAP